MYIHIFRKKIWKTECEPSPTFNAKNMRFRITQDLRVSGKVENTRGEFKKICQKPTPEGWPAPI